MQRAVDVGACLMVWIREFIRSISALIDLFSRVLNGLASILIVSVALLVNYEAFSRYLLQEPTNWIPSGSSLALVYITFLAVGWVQKHDGHVRIDTFLTILPQRAQLYLELISTLIAAVVCVIWTVEGIKAVWENFQNNILIVDSFGAIPRAYVIGVIPLGASLMVFYLLRKAWASACSIGLSPPRPDRG